MRSKTAGLGIVLAFSLSLVAGPAAAHAEQPASALDQDTQSLIDSYRRGQLELFDTLRNDASPRRQVLAARLYVDDEDMPTALRPKREDVAANAARLAGDDAVVQWIAADSGNYYSSQCGPTRWPEAEVAALVRLEPDNAGALQYAVALAHAKGDSAALDDALARMAAATRTDDHFGDEVAEWRKVFAARPEAAGPGVFREDASTEEHALLGALQRADSDSAPAASALESVCKPDGDVEQAWQRLGWCVEAGTLLAGKGNRFALRETGLKMLAAAGATPGDLAELQRQLDWLKAYAANPLRNGVAFRDALPDLVADWRDSPSEIAATERRLKRLGQPQTPPAGWLKTDAEEEVETSAAENAWKEYVRALLEDMRGSADAGTQALALASDKFLASWLEADGPADAKAPEDAPARDALTALAAANPDDLLVQWVAATSLGDVAYAAIANVQRLDPDNAAAWGLSLSPAGSDTQAILQRMAAAKRYDEHFTEVLAPWLAAVRKRPMPAASFDASLLPPSAAENLSADAMAKSTAMMFAMNTSTNGLRFGSVHGACKKPGETDDTLRKACTAIGRLMLNASNTIVSALIGAAVLREVGPLDANDRQRERRIAWWHENQLGAFAAGGSFETYFDDFASTGSEIEAQRLAATRAGKAEPPAEWKSPAEKRAEKGK